ncbi:MAG: hypothetical protein AB7I33_00620 [Gemmatimonadales bacterium]
MRAFKLLLATAGMLFAVIGIAREDRLIVWGAIGLLAVAFVIRLIERRVGRRAGGPTDDAGPSGS